MKKIFEQLEGCSFPEVSFLIKVGPTNDNTSQSGYTTEILSLIYTTLFICFTLLIPRLFNTV